MKSPPPGLRATFALAVGVAIQRGPHGDPRRIEKIETNYVIARGLESGRLSRIKIANLGNYRVSQQQ